MQLRTLATALLCAAIATAFAQSSLAADPNKTPAAAAEATDAKPSATLNLASEQMRLIMGGSKGKGVLHYKGKEYPFTFKSASGGVGAKMVTKVSATGNVFGLNTLEDFAGRYVAASKTAMVGTSTGTATYKNDKGVTVVLRGTSKGVGLSLGASTAVIELVKP